MFPRKRMLNNVQGQRQTRRARVEGTANVGYGFRPNTPVTTLPEQSMITKEQSDALAERGYRVYQKRMIKEEVRAAQARGEDFDIQGVMLWRDPVRGLLAFNVKLLGYNPEFGGGAFVFENLDAKAEGKPQEQYTFPVFKERLQYDWLFLKGPAIAPGERLVGGSRSWRKTRRLARRAYRLNRAL